MTNNQDNEYNAEEGLVFADALAQKAQKEAILSGCSKKEAQNIAQKKFNEVSRKHAIEYMKSIDMKLASLSNQSIANLLKALIAMGLDIEDDEELEYWIGILTQQTLNRIASYFNQRDSASLWKQITSRPQETSVLRNLKNYSPKEIEALSEMIQCLDKINIAKTKDVNIRNKRSDMLKRIDRAVKNDLRLKVKENQQQRQQNRNRNRQTEEPSTEDPADILKNKMTAEGVEVNGRYWDQVMSDFEASANKTEFAKHWTIDNTTRNDLDIRKENEIKEENNDLERTKELERQEQEHEQQRQQQEIEQQQQQQQPQDSRQPTEEIQPAENLQEIAPNENRTDYAEMIMIKRGIKEDNDSSNKDGNKSKSSENSKSNSSGNQMASAANQSGGR